MCALFGRSDADEAPGLWEEGPTWFQRHRGLLWRTVALALWGGTLLWFYFGDRLVLYIRSIYHPFALGAGLLLCGLAVLEFVSLLVGHRRADCCPLGHDKEHGHSAGRLAAIVVIVPLAINALVPSTGLTSYAVGKRATSVDYSAMAGQLSAEYEGELARAEELAQEYPELTIAQILTWASQDPEGVTERKLSVIGFVYHPAEFPPDSFVLVRFKMWCCAADAYPMQLAIQWPQAAQVEKDRWVRVRGTVTFTTQAGERLPGMKAHTVEYIKSPRNHYM